jgi:murein endopeptidase
MTGRVALSCFDQGALQVQSWINCATNRSYVSPELKEVLEDTAKSVEAQFPGTVTLVLDGNFPFLVGFPLLPHLSHDDGEKVDLAFYYADDTGYRRGVTKSPIGYFAFEPGPTSCPKVWPSLRWDFAFLQGMWPDLALDLGRTRAVLQILAADPRVGKIFVEPHLQQTLGVAEAKIRFQGCRAARHDDHIHFQL